jgi:hypothetical protein
MHFPLASLKINESPFPVEACEFDNLLVFFLNDFNKILHVALVVGFWRYASVVSAKTFFHHILVILAIVSLVLIFLRLHLTLSFLLIVIQITLINLWFNLWILDALLWWGFLLRLFLGLFFLILSSYLSVFVSQHVSLCFSGYYYKYLQ